MKLRKRTLASRITALALVLMILCTCDAFALTTYTTLEFGSRGADVLALQKALQSLGFDPNGLDGKFGRGTENAVILYQTSKSLSADGKAGTLTLQTLYADVASSADSTSIGDTTTTTTRVSTNPNTLEYGDSGDKVTALQTALVKLGYSTNGIDGRFGAGTRKAVTAFQEANGLTADGLAGSQTQTLIYSKAAAVDSGNSDSNSESSSDSNTDSGSSSDSAAFTRTLRKGYTGSDVKSVQTQLKSLGYYTYTVDGVYGSGTMASVSAFQKKNNLSVDGLVGAKTYAKLFSSNAVASDASSSGSDSSSDSTGDSGSSDSGTTYVSLSLGSSGDEVKALQKALKALGYNVVVDGDFGSLTKTAIVQFQTLNGLTVDGTAGALTQVKLYSSSAVKYDQSVEENTTIDDDTGKASGPSVSSVKCLYWYTEVKPTIKSGQHITVFDPATNLQWTLRLYSLGHHADSEPLTAIDTAIMYKAFGNTNTWTPKPVYVQLPSGVWTLASMHNVPHLSGTIKDNNFDGHLCVHFLRTIEECQANDPYYGMQHQTAIRKKWKSMTGLDIAD
ncbi:MAG: peptidoglycan-binding protein [Eubacteriales bacterium]|nr:peptidoglycan-binding protein [Eubacteriales bacterium]